MLLKPPSLQEEYDFIYSGDPALDTEAAGFADLYRRFVETGDASLLPIKDGQKPTIFTLRRLHGRARRWLGQFSTEDRTAILLYQACRLALESWRDWDGVEWDAFQKSRIRDVGLDCYTEDSMDALDRVDDGGLVSEIGLHVVNGMAPSGKS